MLSMCLSPVNQDSGAGIFRVFFFINYYYISTVQLKHKQSPRQIKKDPPREADQGWKVVLREDAEGLQPQALGMSAQKYLMRLTLW